MATHSSILAWKIPWTEQPGGLQSMGLQESGTWFNAWTIANPTYVNTEMTSVQFSSVPQSCLTPATPWTAACQTSLSITNSHSLLKLMSIESVMPPNHLILCRPLLLLPSIFPSIRVFSNESGLHIRWPKYWSFSFTISPSNEYSGLISFRMDWLDLLAVQGTLNYLGDRFGLYTPVSPFRNTWRILIYKVMTLGGDYINFHWII